MQDKDFLAGCIEEKDKEKQKEKQQKDPDNRRNARKSESFFVLTVI